MKFIGALIFGAVIGFLAFELVVWLSALLLNPAIDTIVSQFNISDDLLLRSFVATAVLLISAAVGISSACFSGSLLLKNSD